MKKLFIGLFALLSLFTLVACSEEKTPVDPNEFEQNEETFVPDINMWIIGSHWNSWTPATVGDEQAFVKDENSSGLDTKYTYTATVTQEMIGDFCGFKFIGVKDWAVQFGMEDIDYSKCNQAFIDMIGDVNKDGKCDAQDKYFFHEGTSNRNNIVVTMPGTFVIEYYPYNFASEEVNGVPYSCKFAVQFTPAA